MTDTPHTAWQKGYTSGHSNAMRRMSDEPDAPTTPNPYPESTPRSQQYPPRGGAGGSRPASDAPRTPRALPTREQIAETVCAAVPWPWDKSDTVVTKITDAMIALINNEKHDAGCSWHPYVPGGEHGVCDCNMSEKQEQYDDGEWSRTVEVIHKGRVKPVEPGLDTTELRTLRSAFEVTAYRSPYGPQVLAELDQSADTIDALRAEVKRLTDSDDPAFDAMIAAETERDRLRYIITEAQAKLAEVDVHVYEPGSAYLYQVDDILDTAKDSQ